MASSNLQSDVEQWLYRQGELVLGPVGADQLEEMLFAGTLHGQSEIAPLGSSGFRRIGEVDLFRVTVAKAEAKLRVEAAARAEAERLRRQRLKRLAFVGAAAGVAALGAAGAARYLAIHASLGSGSGEGDALITMEPPIISLARASAGEGEELVAYGETPRPAPGGSAPSGALAEARPGLTGATSRASTRSRKAGPEPGARPAPARMGQASEADGLQTGAFDQVAINAVVARHQKGLFPCLEMVARKRPGAPTRVPIEFVIGNDGRVSQVWVDHADFKTGELPACLLRELQRWPFKPYEGERATVNLAFTVGSRG